MENTSAKYISNTLSTMPNVPDTICANCQNALWYYIKPSGNFHPGQPKLLKVFCKVMNKQIDDDLTACDGNPV
jgi:hypothetical protein